MSCKAASQIFPFYEDASAGSFWFLLSVIVSYFHTLLSALHLVLEREHIDPFDNLIWFIFCISVISVKMYVAVGTARVTTPLHKETEIEEVRYVKRPGISNMLPRWQFTLNEGGKIHHQSTPLAWSQTSREKPSKNCLEIISYLQLWEDFLRNRQESKRGNLLESAKSLLSCLVLAQCKPTFIVFPQWDRRVWKQRWNLGVPKLLEMWNCFGGCF